MFSPSPSSTSIPQKRGIVHISLTGDSVGAGERQHNKMILFVREREGGHTDNLDSSSSNLILYQNSIIIGDIYKYPPKAYNLMPPGAKNFGTLLNAHNIWHRTGRHLEKFIYPTRFPFMIDSGGFQRNKYKGFSLDSVLEIYQVLRPDIAVAYDVARTSGNLLDNNIFQSQMAEYMVALKAMVNHLDPRYSLWLPVLHGYSHDEIDQCWNIIRESGFYRKIDTQGDDVPMMVGLGSIVPLLRPTNIDQFTRRYGMAPRALFADLVSYVRKKFPSTFLHVFGVGTPKPILEAFRAGTDSVDTRAWHLKAVFGDVLLKTGKIMNPKNYLQKMEDPRYRTALVQCQCPICKSAPNYETLVKDTFFGPRAPYRQVARATHNLFQYFYYQRAIEKQDSLLHSGQDGLLAYNKYIR